MRKIISTLVAIAFVALSSAASAVVIGGPEVGWSLELDQVPVEQQKKFGWPGVKIETKGWTEFNNTYKVPGDEWKLNGRVIAVHMMTRGAQMPAYVSFMELLGTSKLEQFKKFHYRTMSESKGFTENGCREIATEIQSCEVLLASWVPERAFYSSFYTWQVNGRTFALVVRNAQPTPDRQTPEEAIKALVPLIKMVGGNEALAAAKE
jgi:hypothetical protein